MRYFPFVLYLVFTISYNRYNKNNNHNNNIIIIPKFLTSSNEITQLRKTTTCFSFEDMFWMLQHPSSVLQNIARL